jgi:2-polyprenyl-6-methoxyphenol hydroxylase-like FAD-dependent oxidoreductase
MGGSGEADVLVIGAGPAGLFAAVELARCGVRARVVERTPWPHRQARATALQPATLEILHRAGCLDQVLSASVHVRYARVFDADLSCVSELAFAGAGCPWEFQCSLPQYRTEQILTERLTALGGVVDRGISVVSVTEREVGVLAGLEDADGTRSQAEAAWVIGAGGAHSTTRASMDEHLAGSTYPGTALVADVRVTCGLPRDGSALVGCAAGYVFLAPLPGGRWLTFVGDLDRQEAEDLGRDPAPGRVAAAIGRRIPDHLVRVDDVAWASTFRMQRRLAPRLADSRRFLLGDAGHLSSPFGGEGLNSGLPGLGCWAPSRWNGCLLTATFWRSPTRYMSWPARRSSTPGPAPSPHRPPRRPSPTWSGPARCWTSATRAVRWPASTCCRAGRCWMGRPPASATPTGPP